eukprot:Hpha_TRINITY_DN16908_c0_g4::TRINITY_DN16908_c0_g4_i3::g.53675::m.53675
MMRTSALCLMMMLATTAQATGTPPACPTSSPDPYYHCKSLAQVSATTQSPTGASVVADTAPEDMSPDEDGAISSVAPTSVCTRAPSAMNTGNMPTLTCPLTSPPSSASVPTTSAPTGPSSAPSASTGAPTAQATVGAAVSAPAALSPDIAASPQVAAVLGAPAGAVSAANIENLWTIGQVRSISIPGLGSISFTVRGRATTSQGQGAANSGRLAVAIDIEVNIAQILSNVGLYKLIYMILLCTDMGLNLGQMVGMKFVRVNGQIVGRKGKALAETVSAQFSVCDVIGCVPTDISTLAIPDLFAPEVLRLPAVTQAFSRSPRAVDLATIQNTFQFGSTVTSSVFGLPTVHFTVQATPAATAVAATYPTGTVSFYMPVDIDFALISANAGQFKSAYQLAIGNKLNVNPYQVDGVVFVKSTNGDTLARRGQALAVDRVNVNQNICPTLCSGNQLPATPAPGDSDDDTVIIVVAVVVPVVVIALVIIIFCCCCKKDDEKTTAHEPYAHSEEKAQEIEGEK